MGGMREGIRAIQTFLKQGFKSYCREVGNETIIKIVSNPGVGGKQMDPISFANKAPSKTFAC